MINWAFHIQNSIDLYILWETKGKAQTILHQDRLMPDNWEVLSYLKMLLQPFKWITLLLEGYAKNGTQGAIWEVFPSMDLLLNHLEMAKIDYEHSSYPYLKMMVNNTWLVLDKYYSQTDSSLVYITAVFLYPWYKWFYFEQKWAQHSDWIQAGKIAVWALWNLQYQDHEITDIMESRMDIEESLLDDWMNLGLGGNVFLSSANEYEQYSLSSHDLSIWNPIE